MYRGRCSETVITLAGALMIGEDEDGPILVHGCIGYRRCDGSWTWEFQVDAKHVMLEALALLH